MTGVILPAEPFLQLLGCVAYIVNTFHPESYEYPHDPDARRPLQDLPFKIGKIKHRSQPGDLTGYTLGDIEGAGTLIRGAGVCPPPGCS
jgi:hypothetical protein